MHSEIIKILAVEEPLKGRDIAKKLDLERKKVNSFLHKNSDFFQQDENSMWSLPDDYSRCIEFPTRWVTSKDFESSFAKSGDPLVDDCQLVVILIPDGCQILLEASSKLLALCNQLQYAGKDVFIKFDDIGTFTYLDRCGFLDHLSEEIRTEPERPKISRAVEYKRNNKSVIEIRQIDPNEKDEEIPKEFTEIFVEHTGADFTVLALTIFGELFENVCEHSQTVVNGFAALQKYAKRIQVAVSDNGIGIANSLKPIFSESYPELKHCFNLDDPGSCLDLIEKMLTEGGITSRVSTGEKGHGGTGLFRSQGFAQTYSATMLIRQETSEIKMIFKNGELYKTNKVVDMPTILGTHVCFIFNLDI